MKKKIFWVVRLITSFVMLFFILSKISLEEIFQNIAAANVWYVLVGFAIAQVNVYISALKLNVLTRKQKMLLTVNDIFKINYITKFYDMLFPQVISGGVIRWHILSKNDKKPAQALAAMIINRLIEYQMLIALGLIFWIIDMPPNSNNIAGVSLALLTIAVFSIYPIVLNQKIFDFLLKFLRKIPFFPQIIIEKLNKLFVSIAQYKKLSISELNYVFFVNLARHLVGIFSIYIICVSLDLNITFIGIGWIRTLLQIVCVLPISVNGIGVQEGSLIYMLGLYGISPESAVALSFLLYVLNVIGAIIGGVFLVIGQFSKSQSKLGAIEE